MKKLVTLSALLLSVAVSSPLCAGQSRGGSACVDVNLAATCSANVITATISVTNCGTGGDTINLTETLVDPSGAVISSESASAYLKAGKTTSYKGQVPVSSDVTPGTYTVTVTGVAARGGGTDTAVLSLAVPCP